MTHIGPRTTCVTFYVWIDPCWFHLLDANSISTSESIQITDLEKRYNLLVIIVKLIHSLQTDCLIYKNLMQLN